MKLQLTILFVLCFQIINAQYLEQYESDDYAENGRIYCTIMHDEFLYTGGRTNDNGDLVQPCVRKLDTNGNVLWSTTANDFDSNESNLYIKEIYVSEDGFLYCLTRSEDSATFHNELWKVDTLSGEIIYKTLVYWNQLDLSGIVDYNMDMLLLNFEGFDDQGAYSIGFFDKLQGMPLYSEFLPSGSIDILKSDGDTIYYFGLDNVFKTTLANINTPIWNTTVTLPGTEINFSKLYFSETTNRLYAFGYESVDKKGVVSCFNQQTGEVIWTVLTNSDVNVDFQDLEVDENFMYISWRHTSISGSHYNLISKVDLISGEVIWEFEGDYEEFGDQAVLDLNIDDNYIYLTGYHDSGNFGASIWGVMKLSKINGEKLFSRNISSPDFDNSQGLGIFPLNDKIICIGNINNKEVFAELNLDGDITMTKEIGGTALNPSATTSITQLNDGKIAITQQKGSRSEFSIRDVEGNVEWRLPLVYGAGFNVTCAHIENDSLIILAGLTTSEDLYIIEINPIEHQVLRYGSLNANDFGRAILDITYKQDDYIILSTINLDGSAEINKFRILFGGNWTGSNDVYNAEEISSTYFDRFSNANLILELSENSFLLLKENEWVELMEEDLSILGTHEVDGIGNFSHLNFNNDTSSIVFLGKTVGSGNLSVISVDPLTLTEQFTYEVAGHQADGIKWVQGEQDDYIYILSDDNSEVFVTKFDLSSQEVIWTTSASSGNLNFPFTFATDIAFNLVENYITITGYRENSPDDQQAFFRFISSDGALLAGESRDGNFIGKNNGLTVMGNSSSSATLIGGQISRDTSILSSFIYYYDENTIQFDVTGKVFFDIDENGIHNDAEPLIDIGSILIDDYETYLHSDGFFQKIISEGPHTVTYNLDSNWALSTDSLTYHIDTNNPNSSLDTLCFGIKALNIVDKVEPYIFAQAFVCNLPTTSQLKIKNNGTTIQDVLIKYNTNGYATEAIPVPDSIVGNNFFWTYNQLIPGTSEEIQLVTVMPGVESFDEILAFEATAYLVDTNAQSITDSCSYVYEEVLLCAYDPNDKQVSPVGIGEDDLTLFEQYLNYTIRFQNTGNYPAKDIVITDTLDTNLDLSTFEFIGASHPITEINKNDNALAFVFNNIYLPDSINNESESHGSLSFRILPNTDLSEGIEINNTAHIYFDLNPPIVTNTTRNVLVSEFTNIVQTQGDNQTNYKLYPNPTSGEITIESINSIQPKINWKLIDILGRRTRSGVNEGNQQLLNFTSVKKGIYFLEVNQEAIFKIIIN